MKVDQSAPALSAGVGDIDARQILKERAQALAHVPESSRTEPMIEVIEFGLAGEHYAVCTTSVREVYPLKDLTPVPCTPPFVLGIINVRGQILPVIDIKIFFDLPQQGLTDLNKVIIVRNDDIELGILADIVFGVRAIPLSSLQLSLPTLAGTRDEYLKGVTPDRLVVLEIEKILADPKIIINEEVEPLAGN